jgi:predicted small integral membrane protein
MIVRGAKISFVVFVGIFGLIVGFDNIIDYQTNFEVVRHVMSMDTTHPGNRLMWRAITNETLHHLVYWIIIATELFFGGVSIFGAWRLFRALRADAALFNAAKDTAVLGLAVGFALYFFGFMIIGGEWFQMWQSAQWNMQEPAFRFIGCVGFVLLFLSLPDRDPRASSLESIQ